MTENEMDTPKNPIPVSLQTVLEDLDFLSQIQRDKKPCFKSKVFVDANSWSGAFYRLLKQESRNGIIHHVEQIINRAIEAIDNSKYEEHLPLVINGLNSAREGLCNLTFTYNRDPKVKSHINVQLQNMDIQLNRFKHLLRGFTPAEVVANLPPSPHSIPSSANNVSTSISVSVPSSNTEVVVEKMQTNSGNRSQSSERVPPPYPPSAVPIPINIELDMEENNGNLEKEGNSSSDNTPPIVQMESPNLKSDGVGNSKSVSTLGSQPTLDLNSTPLPSNSHNPPMDRRKIRKIRTRK